MEVLISFVLLLIIAAVALSVFNVANKIWQEDAALLDLQQTVRSTIDAMVREIRQSNPGDIVLDPSYSGAKITFKVLENNNEISYYLEDVNGMVYVVREHPTGTKKLLAHNVDSLCFCWDGATNSCSVSCSDVLAVRIAASKNVKQKNLQFNLIEKVRLRNE